MAHPPEFGDYFRKVIMKGLPPARIEFYRNGFYVWSGDRIVERAAWEANLCDGQRDKLTSYVTERFGPDIEVSHKEERIDVEAERRSWDFLIGATGN